MSRGSVHILNIDCTNVDDRVGSDKTAVMSLGQGTEVYDQLSEIRPNIHPAKVGIAIPTVYHTAQNGMFISGHRRTYVAVPIAPDNKPTAAPDSRSRVGARPRIAQDNER
jgi:hypothetical protein